MTHDDGVARVKSLQKEFLHWVEEHPYLSALDHDRHNRLRRSAFKSTFEAFRLGRVGIRDEAEAMPLWSKFFGWAAVIGLPDNVELEIQAMCFRVSLEVFRVGAMVTAAKGVTNGIQSG